MLPDTAQRSLAQCPTKLLEAARARNPVAGVGIREGARDFGE
jgi:hypothetical protein